MNIPTFLWRKFRINKTILAQRPFLFYLEDLILVRLKRVQLQLQVSQVPKSHSLQKKYCNEQTDLCKMKTDLSLQDIKQVMKQL